MTRYPIRLLPGVLFVLFAGCSSSEKPTEPSIISEDQLVNPRDTSYTADSLAPPPPAVWVESIVEGLRIRFNGQFSETTPDSISGMIDFEGYRIRSAGRSNFHGTWPLLAAFDLLDFDKWIYLPDSGAYVLFDIPYSLDSLRCLYADSCEDINFTPRSYTRSRPYQHPDFPESTFIFVPHSHNISDLESSWGIHKVYPDEPDPSTLTPGQMTLDRFTEEGFLKFYEYEFIPRGMHPGYRYWLNVTVLDFGYTPLGIEPSESDHWSGAIGAYPRIR